MSETEQSADTGLQEEVLVAEGGQDAPATEEGETSTLEDRLEHEGDIAADYLEELLDIADLDGDLDMDVEGERAVVSIVGADLQQLVGENGTTLDALQELTRLAVYRETGERSRLMLDISGHRAARRDYLEELLDIADLDGDLDMDVEGERAVVSIVGADLQQLVGENGTTLDALQELTRLAVYRETGERSRLMLDISGHRAARRRELEELAADTATQVKESGERAALRPMTPFERKVVHDAVAAAGLSSESEGVEPRRYVVVLPA